MGDTGALTTRFPPPPGVTVRAAAPADRTAILGLMRKGDFNRINLRTESFLVAETAGEVVGIGQIKRHRDGTPELASLVVDGAWQGRGVGSALVARLVEDGPQPLYLFCLDELEGYYGRLGFARLGRAQAPRLLGAILGTANTMLGLVNALQGEDRRVIIMGRDGPRG